MDRYAALERLQARAHRQLPAAAREQFAPFRTLASEWARLAVSGTDADLLSLLLDRGTERAPVKLLRQADPAPLARALEQAMAPAILTGATTRLPRRSPIAAKAGAARGKPCGNSFIPAWKKCRLTAGSVEDILDHIREGRTGNYIAEGKPLPPNSYGMVKKHFPSMKSSATPSAASDDIRHVLKHHAAELTAKDWASVLDGPRPGDALRRTATQSGSAALEVWTPRENGHLLKVYRVTATSLSLHTMKRKKEKATGR